MSWSPQVNNSDKGRITLSGKFIIFSNLSKRAENRCDLESENLGWGPGYVTLGKPLVALELSSSSVK